MPALFACYNPSTNRFENRPVLCFSCRRPFGTGPDDAHCLQAINLGGGPSHGQMGAPPFGDRTVCDGCTAAVYRSVGQAR